ncbi:MAG TPA: ASKHA domain-containing protein, partial [bacterium]|nr:ASKHA domain-containing protein [bacterium]
PQSEREQQLFAEMPKPDEWHLSCVTSLEQDCTIVVPPESTVISSADKRSLGQDIRYDDPVYTKQFAQITPPGLDNGPLRSHTEALAEPFGFDAGDILYSALMDLPHLFPYFRNSWDVTVVSDGTSVFCIESGDTRSRFFGLAFDIGTTSLVVSLVDLASRQILGEMCASNPQAIWGADVIARIGHIQNDPQGLDQLRSAVLESLAEMVQKICRQFDVNPLEVYAATFVGNTIMEHTLLGISPEAIATLPFHPVFRHEWVGRAERIRLPINPHGRVYVSPVVSGYVGGDTLAVILATDLDERDELTLAIDLGTNGELALGHKNRIYACAAAAGPAFEGGRLRCGMRAVPGAISSVRLGDDVEVTVLGDVDPIGICGSGLLDAVAEMVRLGIVEDSGAMARPSHGVSKSIADRVIGEQEHALEFLLTHDGQRPVRITQKDIREFQLAKGAVRAGCEVMMEEMGCKPEDVQRVLVSGAFGTHLRAESIAYVGLLPKFPRE